MAQTRGEQRRATWLRPAVKTGRPHWSIRSRSSLRAAEAPVVTIADDLEAARWVVRAADWDPRVEAAVSE
jgi:hypothetical protein